MPDQLPAITYGTAPDGSVRAFSFGSDGLTELPIGKQAIASKITDAANAAGVDPQFAVSTAHAESGLNHNVTSPKGAIGVMQLMPNTAKGLGVDPYNEDDNIKGGIAYQKQLLDMFGGNQQLAAAAYNAGPQAVIDHGGVPPYPETQAYVKKVTGTDPANSNEMPSPDELRGQAKIQSVTSDIPSPEDLRNTGKNLSPQPQPPAPQQTPGYQKAFGEASTALNKSGDPLGGIGGQFVNAFAANTLPITDATVISLSTGIQNFLHNKLGVGNNTGYNMKEAFNAARQAEADKLSSYSEAHPRVALAANIAGFAASPVTKALAVAAPAKIASALPAALQAAKATPYIASLMGAGLTGAAAGAGQSASEGGDARQIAKGALINGAVSAPFGPAGELLNGAGAAFKTPVARALAPVAAHAALGAAGTGGLSYLSTHNPKTALQFAAIGGAMGAGGKAAGIRKTNELPPNINDTDRLAALHHIVHNVSKGNYEVAASHFENSPEDLHTSVEAASPEHRQQLLQTMGAQHEANLGNIQEKVAARQEPQIVKGRLKGNIEKVVGAHPDIVSQDVASAPHREAANIAAQASPEELIGHATSNISKAVGIDPREAEINWEDVAEKRRDTVSSPLWKKVDNETPVNSEEHKRLLAEEPVVRKTLGQAQHVLGPEGFTPNPDYKEPDNLKTPANLTNQDINEYWKANRGKEIGLSTDPQHIADFLNKQNGASIEEPKYLPTQKAWILAERYLKRSVPRNLYGAVDYSHPNTIEMQSLHQDVNAANKEHFEGLSEAKVSSGEDAASEKANELGFKFNPKALNNESAEKFIERYNGQNDIQQAATKHGYMQRFFQKFRENPVATAKEYLNSDQHQKVAQTLFGKNAEAFNGELNKVVETADQLKNGGPIANTISKAQRLISGENIAEFNHAWESEQPEAHELYHNVYTDHLNQKINAIRAEDGTIEPKHLGELQKLITSDFHKNAQDKIYGKEAAEKFRATIQREIDLAKTGKEIAGFKANVPKEEDALKPTASATFGALSKASSGIVGMMHGAFLGLAGSKAYKTAQFVHQTIKQGDMTPGAHRAMGEYLAKPPKELAVDIRNAEAQKRNIKMSKSTLKDSLAKRITVGTGLAAGTAATNAFSGVDTRHQL